MAKLEGKVAFVTGAARGQGRSHALRLAQDGADIIAVDICAPIESVPYPLATPDDLLGTVKAVESLGRRIVAEQADVRDMDALRRAFEIGIAELGVVDIVVANAGVWPMSMHSTPEGWQDVVDVNLTGVYNTVEVSKGQMIDRGSGGSYVLISSTAGLNGMGGDAPGGLGYTAAKHGVVGLMRAYANYLAPHSIRVNSVHPTGVRTPMIINDAAQEYFDNDPAMAKAMENALPIDMIEPEDISEAIAWLASDAARYVTGVALPIDAGFTNKK